MSSLPINPSESFKRRNPHLYDFPPNQWLLKKGVERERDLHDGIREELAKLGWIGFSGSMAHKTHRTIAEPDFVILADRGRVFLVEAKSRSGKLTKEQAALKAWAQKLGHTIVEIRSMIDFRELIHREL